MITQLFPNSAITYKNLGEAYTVLQDTHKAKEAFNKAISMDPNGKIGTAAKEMLLNVTD